MGADYPPGTVFPTEEDQTAYPACAARCVAGRSPPAPQSLEALPSGACTVEGERCGMGLQYFCPPDGVVLGRVDLMRCTCTSGSWSCVTAIQGAGICAGASPDGGGVASDGGSD